LQPSGGTSANCKDAHATFLVAECTYLQPDEATLDHLMYEQDKSIARTSSKACNAAATAHHGVFDLEATVLPFLL
jgi:hypothetical protein